MEFAVVFKEGGGGAMDVELTQAEQAMLQMAKLGLNRTAVCAQLEIQGYHRDHLRYLSGPVVVSNRGMLWMDTLPEWLMGAIWYDRLEEIIAEHKQDSIGTLSTLSEVTALLMLESLVAPLGPEWSNVYLGCCREVYTKHRGAFPPDLDKDIPALTDYEKDRFRDRIRREIRYKVIQAAPRIPHTTRDEPVQYALDL